ncbi:hydroxyacylglutathione hydrolase GLO4 NDAI_0F00750 [Naumovozyma dairenensis CBS 421]|uniref:hydroxyacylglutathione hydrolase n=1 Tax=Naumovozyma dairenensis (strain ATCC 10597 / BCRC 20456 / CBS 421 / NBRC 0211 / NRRL Y-12639) TaxID=1071378 RepID=G0WC83_NAUDC|nr:hypothetical protein NDAI_0F00750 [Naumovozyma dairenensis CBS 421]CCD25394.1 hypothetical protein NDAI_0F00750 [Naumovozyma dairenensis CBS 421]
MRWNTGGVNYCYLLSSQDKLNSWLIDPAESDEVIPNLTSSERQSIKAIVNTHHHYDHSDGNMSMINELKQEGKRFVVKIVAGSKSSPDATELPEHLQHYKLGNLDITCIRTPCHTVDSICYHVKDPETNEQCIFTGDTLFIGGCGRFFEGNGVQMDEALNERIIHGVGEPNWNLTRVYPGHEYTKSNVKFIREYVYQELGENEALDNLEKYADKHEMTCGEFTIDDELKYNPFMRLDDPLVRKAVGDDDSSWKRSKVMETLRKLKNSM